RLALRIDLQDVEVDVLGFPGLAEQPVPLALRERPRYAVPGEELELEHDPLAVDAAQITTNSTARQEPATCPQDPPAAPAAATAGETGKAASDGVGRAGAATCRRAAGEPQGARTTLGAMRTTRISVATIWNSRIGGNSAGWSATEATTASQPPTISSPTAIVPA